MIGAYQIGEPDDAIALDQVLLREGESKFELWIPSEAYELLVTSPSGAVDVDIEMNGTELRLRRTTAAPISKW